jgi:uncharacterized protein YeaO (DUF488 family)
MTIKLKLLKDPIDKEADGLRILISLYRPRDLPKSEENWDQWKEWKSLAPSKQLHKDTQNYKKSHHGDISGFWPEYVSRFIPQIDNDPKAQQTLEKLSIYVKPYIPYLLSHLHF